MPHWINPADGICRRRQKYAVQRVHSGAELIRKREPLFEFLVVPPDLDFEATQPEVTLSRHLRYWSYWLLSVELAPPPTASKATFRLMRTGKCALPTAASPILADSGWMVGKPSVRRSQYSTSNCRVGGRSPGTRTVGVFLFGLINERMAITRQLTLFE
jgi:hypothetical protein